MLASRSSCSCWARYWAGFCLASLAQWRSSRCSSGKLACGGRTAMRGRPGAPANPRDDPLLQHWRGTRPRSRPRSSRARQKSESRHNSQDRAPGSASRCAWGAPGVRTLTSVGRLPRPASVPADNHGSGTALFLKSLHTPT